MIDYYPIIQIKRVEKLNLLFPRKHLVIVRLEYIDHNNRFPKINQGLLLPRDYIVISSDSKI